MPTKPKCAVVIGRMQPFHMGHKALVDFALEQAEMVVICLGSAYQPRTSKNPWTFNERMEMIHRVYRGQTDPYDKSKLGVAGRIEIVPIRDHMYNDALWIAEVQNRVYQAVERWEERTGHKQIFGKVKREEVVLVGHQKDDSSFYLSIFGWRCIEFPNHGGINATDLREQFLTNGGNMSDDLPVPVRELMGQLRTAQPIFDDLCAELSFLKQYRAATQTGEYPVQFITVDSVLVAAGHVLMVKRGGHPGKGMWALPGGYVSHKETIQDAVLRELKEETAILVDEQTLKGSIAAQKVYDAPGRDLRGRIVTNAFLFKLPESTDLPKVKGGDDAQEARWISFGDLQQMEGEIYSDHLHIINDLLSRGY